MRKKLLSILLSLAMVITMMPIATMTAFAQTTYSFSLDNVGAAYLYSAGISTDSREDMVKYWKDNHSYLSEKTFGDKSYDDKTWNEYYNVIEEACVAIKFKFYKNNKTFSITLEENIENCVILVITDKNKFAAGASYATYYGVTDGSTITLEKIPFDSGKLESDSPTPTPTPDPTPTDKEKFETYKTTAKANCDAVLVDGDSDAVKALVADAKKAIGATEYDATKTLADNKLVLDGIVSELKQNVIEQRADEDLTKIAQATKINLSKIKAIKKGKNKLTYKVADDGLYVAKYQIYKSTKKNSGFKKIATTSKKTYTDSKKLKKGKKYYYKVRGMVKLSTGKYVYTKWSSVKSVKAK